MFGANLCFFCSLNIIGALCLPVYSLNNNDHSSSLISSSLSVLSSSPASSSLSSSSSTLVSVSPSSTSSPSSFSKEYLSSILVGKYAYPKSNPSKLSLATQKWLIDNINRVRHELNELTKDYNQHIDSARNSESRLENQLVKDIISLRADHTVLSQHQEKIIQLIKESSNLSSYISPYIIPSLSSNLTKELPKLRIKRRHSIRQFIKREKQFEENTKHNITELYEQIDALHEMVNGLYTQIQSLEKEITYLKSEKEFKSEESVYDN